MNIIYLLTNLEREEGRRFYVGSKAECFIENINGIDRIVSAKTGLPYYGSASCPMMKDDMAKGARLEAKILEEVPNKKFLLEAEDNWIVKLNAVDSPEYYNISYARIGGHSYDQFAAYNMYGETILSYGKAVGSLNNRHKTAKRFGYKNMAEFAIWIYKRFQEGYNPRQVAEMIGWERHSPARYIKDYDIAKCLSEYQEDNQELQQEIRKLIAEGVSAKKIAEIKNLEIPTVVLYIGDYDQVSTKAFLVAQRRGLTKEELEIQVTKRILQGAGFTEVSRELSINETSVKRYFLRYVRANLDHENL